jgi:RNA polymerase sigma factor (sigma-70 family)
VTRRNHLRAVTSEPASDADVVLRIANGEMRALGVLYDRYASSLYAFSWRLVKDESAEDVVQAVFLRVVQVASSFDPHAASARPWLFGIAVRLVRERRRSFRRFAAMLHARFTAVQPRDRAPFEPLDHRRDLEHALDRLTEAKRVVLLLAEVEGFTCEEISRMLSISVGTVWTRLHHARKELRAHLGELS